MTYVLFMQVLYAVQELMNNFFELFLVMNFNFVQRGKFDVFHNDRT